MEFNETPQINIEAELKKLSKFIDPINFESVQERAENSFESFAVPDAEFSKSIEINSLPESEFFSSREKNREFSNFLELHEQQAALWPLIEINLNESLKKKNKNLVFSPFNS